MAFCVHLSRMEAQAQKGVHSMDEKTNLIPNKLLKAEREKRFWTQADLAEKVGSDAKSVGRWENGKTFPSLYYRQKLCKVFDKTPQELGLSQEAVNPNSHYSDHPHFQISLQRRPAVLLIAFIVLTLLIVIVGSRIYSAAHIKPGGSWISPGNGQTVGSIVHLSAYAYPTDPGDPEIDHVNFTLWWQGVDPRRWVIACSPHIHTASNVYICDINLSQLGASAGQIRISFDVYDRDGHVNFAPNGVHTIIYSPSSK
jgi:transcriptional regulator with XRE-family HTH domain